MAETTDEETQGKKASKKPLVLGLVLALAGGGGGFAAVSTGIIGGAGADTGAGESYDGATGDGPGDGVADVGFVPLDPIVVNLPPGSQSSHLRFAAELEVARGSEAEVAALRPRIVDVLNSYLRAVEIADLTDPGALLRLRSQMLRRVQVVTGEGRVRDLLIMEFVLN